jgi:hypothetical protein
VRGSASGYLSDICKTTLTKNGEPRTVENWLTWVPETFSKKSQKPKNPNFRGLAPINLLPFYFIFGTTTTMQPEPLKTVPYWLFQSSYCWCCLLRSTHLVSTSAIFSGMLNGMQNFIEPVCC